MRERDNNERAERDATRVTKEEWGESERRRGRGNEREVKRERGNERE